MTHTLLVSRHGASHVRREISNARGYADCLICGAPPKVAGEAGSIRLPITPIAQTVDPRQ